jgi:hypothetical protein
VKHAGRFTAFALRLCGLHKQRIQRIDHNKDYGSLLPLVDRSDRTIMGITVQTTILIDSVIA